MTRFYRTMTEQIYRKVWGRRHARPLKTIHKNLLETLLPTIQITLPTFKQESTTALLNPEEIFPGYTNFCLEIGFGGGEHLAWRAQQSPHTGFFGCEPFISGVASLLTQIDAHNLQNIRIINDDARLFMKTLPDHCLDRIYILFPDPWPKKRHNKRRIVHDETIGDFSRLLKKGGELIMATDIEEYALWMQEVLSKRPEFLSIMGNRKNFYERPENWPLTRYEEKGLAAGRLGQFFVYQRLSRDLEK